MRSSPRGRLLTARRSVALALAVIPLGLAACGDDDAEKGTGAKEPAAPAATPPAASALAITTSDAGPERFSTKAPKSIKGGLVKLTFTNAGKDDHEAQLVRIGDHTPEEAVKIYGAEEGPVPEWLRFAGGASAGPGQTVTSTMNLEPGKYAMLDNAAFMGPVNSELGALATFEVTAGTPGELPASTATITALDNEEGEPEHEYEVSGLKLGKNRLLFENKGTEVHHVVMFPILPGKALDDLEKFFASERPSGPPPFDPAKAVGTAVFEGETAGVIDLELRKAGRYALVCFVTDRDGKGKPHFQMGMLKEVEVK